MKHALVLLLTILLAFAFTGCDSTYTNALDIQCSNENVRVIVDGEASDSYSFSSSLFNNMPLTKYKYIDFESKDDSQHNVKIRTFQLASTVNATYNLSLKLVDANHYVVDFLRVAILIDGELRVYKYDNLFEEIYDKENDPDSLLHFHSRSEVFNDVAVTLSADEAKEITVFYWIEEAELYDRNGKRHTGWSDKSYDADPIYLSLDIH